MGDTTSINPQISSVLQQIERFGFKFFGYGENNDPLVIAPNGQVIPLKIAYEFVQEQVKQSQQTESGKGIESMPVAPQMPDIIAPEIKLEKAVENEKLQTQTSANIQTANPQGVANEDKGSNSSSTVAAAMKMPLPFEEGFKIKSFDPTVLDQASEFIEQNKSSSNTSTKAWLAALFKKFIDEYNSKN